MSLVYIGLGSNLGDKRANLAKARDELLNIVHVEILKESIIEETEPVDYLDQPAFLNQIILIKTELNPENLLKMLKSIEKRLGRKKTIPKGPRIIDLDILLYDDLVFKSHRLTIPHPEIKNRIFILKQLVEINPSLLDPLTGNCYADFFKKRTD